MTDRIQIVDTINGKSEQDSCPFQGVGDYCTVKYADKITCRYGLTEIVVPDKCPLRKGPITSQVSLVTQVKRKIDA